MEVLLTLVDLWIITFVRRIEALSPEACLRDPVAAVVTNSRKVLENGLEILQAN